MPRTATSTDLVLDLTPDGSTLKQRLSTGLVSAMATGSLADRDDMPSTRVLAKHLGISRAVVVSVYEELVASGFLVAVPGGRTRVEVGAGAAARAGALSVAPAPAAMPTPAENDVPHQEVPKFDMLPGYPDTTLINPRGWTAAWRSASSGMLDWSDDAGREIDQGRTHRFYRQLCEALADHLRRTRGIVCDPRDIFVFPGVNSALRTLAPILGGAGSTFAFEDPGYATARRVLVSSGHVIRPVPVNANGIAVERLSSSDAAVYVTPAHQFPLGARLPVDSRANLLEWAKRHDALVFEDDYDGEFRYDVAPMPAIRSMNDGSRYVIYLGTSSKTLSRDLRLAWAVVPSRFRAVVRDRLFDEGDSVSSLSAMALGAYIESGALRKHIVSVQRTYSARRQRLTDACRTRLPELKLMGVNAGLHLVLLAGHDFDDHAAVAELAERGLACTPLSRYFVDADRAPMRGLVCGYSRLPETQADRAVSAIRAVLG